MKRFSIFSTIAISSLALTSCAGLFETRVPMPTTGNMAGLGALVVPEVKIEQLNSPAQIFVSQAESPDKIIVTWSTVPGAKSYYIERAVSTVKDSYGNFICPDDSEFVQVGTKHHFGTTFADKILDNPKYSDEEYSYGFFYRISAENLDMGYEPSDFKTSEVAYLLAPPANVKASLGESQDLITVRWEKIPGAKNYEIYRSTREDGSSPVFMGRVTSNQNWFYNYISKIDQGIDFYYSVYANTGSTTSVASGLALGYALQEGAPPKISNVTVAKGRGETTDEITIKWDSAGSDFKYSVYRTSSKDASYTLLSKETTSTTFVDKKGLKPNVYYYYQIQAFKTEEDGSKTKGPMSDSGSESKTPAEGFILVPPSKISVLKNLLNEELCTITFEPVIGSKDYKEAGLTNNFNTYTYEFLGCDTADGSFAPVESALETSLAKDENGNYIVTITTKKYYKIRTINGSAVSQESEVVAPSPFAATNIVGSKAAYIEGYTDDSSMANGNGVFPVKITWEKPKNDIAEGGYHVYRSTNPASGFKRITETPVLTTSYIDNFDTAKAGVYYYYKVLSLNSLGQGANYTDSVLGYGALTPEQYMREYNKTVMRSQKKLKLMHIADDMKKLGSETANGDICGTLSYNAAVAGLGARILMHYEGYADYWANGDSANGYYFFLNGDTNTSASMDASGTMDGTVRCTGMYPGSVVYNNVKIKGGGAAGGTYGIKRDGFEGQVEIDWKIGEEGR